MSFEAKLFIEDEERNILNARQVYSRYADVNGRPTGKPTGGTLDISIESTGNDNFFYNNMFSQTMKCKGEIIFYRRDGFSTLFKIEFANAQILSLSEKFNAIDDKPLHMNIRIGWGIMKMRGIIHEKTWNPNNPFVEITPTVLKEPEPTIVEVSWQNDKDENIQETTYGENVALVVTVDNHDGGTVEISITKEDGSEFEKGKKELTFSESVDDDGKATISKLEIEKQWETLKKVAIDKLIAKVSHNGSSKKSSALKIIPRLKFIAHIRRSSLYKGEYGFDWMRNDYKTICKNYDKLKKEYTPTKIEGKEYFVPWLSMFPKQKDIKLELKIEILENTVAKDDDIIKLPSKNGIKFDPEELKVSEANAAIIKVTCETPLKNNTIIDLKDKNNKIVGKLNILKNANHEQLHFNITPVRILRKGIEQSDKNIIESQIDKGFGDVNKKLADDLKKLETYLNTQSLNQALLQCSIGKVYDIVIDESSWIADDLIIDDGSLFKDVDILEKFYNIFKEQHPIHAKKRGLVVFLSPLSKEDIGGEGELTEIDAKRLIIYQSNLWHKESFAHEISHVLGLTHSFQKKRSTKDVFIMNRFIKQVDDYINYMIKNNKPQTEISKEWKQYKDEYRKYRRYLNIYYRNPYIFEKTKTENIMDYDNVRKSLWKYQWKAVQDDIIKFYNVK